MLRCILTKSLSKQRSVILISARLTSDFFFFSELPYGQRGRHLRNKKFFFFFLLKKDSPVVKTLSCQIRGQGLDPYGEDPTCHVVQLKQRRRKLLSEWPQRFGSTLVSIFSKVASAPLHELSASALS